MPPTPPSRPSWHPSQGELPWNTTPQSRAVRHWQPATLVLLASVLAVLAVLASEEPSFGWDRALAAWLLSFSAPAYDAFMEAVSVPGKRLGVWITMLAGAVLAAWLLGWRAGLLVLVGLGLMGLNEAFKDVPPARRWRPGGGAKASERHTMHARLTSACLASLMPKLAKRRTGAAAAAVLV